MKRTHSPISLKAIIEQTDNSTTSWVGYITGEEKNRVAGQTFFCPSSGDVCNISVYASYVVNKGVVLLTLHEFDAIRRVWGEVIATSELEFTKNDAGKWISFPISKLPLKQASTYGFQLKSDTVFIGVGETAGSCTQLPCNGGQEWVSTDQDELGQYYTYLSLAFKVEMAV